MPISFQCPECEKTLRVPDEKQGKRIKCSGCSTVIKVPDEDEEIEDDPKPARRTKNSAKGGKSKGKRKGKSSDGSPALWIGVAGGAVVVIGLLIWLFTQGGPAGGPNQAGTPGSTVPSVDRTQDRNRIKMLTLAMHNHHDMFGQFPVADRPEYYGPDGRPFLSWRVHVLPYLSKNDLFQKFHLNEPWDSPHNKPLMDQMPDEYKSGNEQGTNTRMQVLTGPKALFNGRKPGFQTMIDGSSNTLLLVQVGPDKAVPWTKPDDVVFDPANGVTNFGNVGASFLCAFGDGMVREFPSTVDAKALAAAATPNGGEIIDPGDLTLSQAPGAGANAMPGMTNSMPGMPTMTPQQSAPGMVGADPVKMQLKQIGLAMHNHHDIFGRLPIAENPMSFDPQGRPLLSWRVHILPFLEHAALYNQFHMNEPWDSPHNKTLIDKMPAVYQGASRQATKTPFLIFTGKGALFSEKLGPSMRMITDGTSNTILVATVADDKMVTWTQPVDIAFDPTNPLAGVGAIPPTGLPLLLVDGSVIRLKPFTPPDLFKSMVSPAGGEIVDYSSMLLSR